MFTIAKTDRYDMINNPGDDKPSFTVWFSGCSIKCPECYNPLLQDKLNGNEYMVDTILFTICHECEKQDIDTVVLIGGEPLEQDEYDLQLLCRRLSMYGYKIWLYTGYEFEDIPESLKQYLYTIKCGKYDKDQKCEGFPSSSNQRIFRTINGTWTQIKL